MTTITSITLSGIDYRNYVDITSVRLEEGLPSNSDSLSFDVVLGYTEFTTGSVPKPVSGQKVHFELSNGEVFNGILSSVGQVPYSTLDSYKFRCQVTESSRLLDKKLVNEKEIPQNYAGNIITNIVQKYAKGFSLGTVNKGFVIPKQTFEYQTVSSVLDSIAQSIGYLWYIDDYSIVFINELTTLAPIPDIDIDTTQTLGGFEITEDVSRLVNRVFIKDFTAKEGGTRTDSFIADENQNFFGLFQQPWDEESVNVTVTPPDGSPTSLDVRLDPLTTREGDIKGSANECYVCILNSGIRFPEDFTPEVGSNVDVEYSPIAGDLVIPIEDVDSIRMMRSRESGGSGPTDGVYERVLSLPEFRVESIDTVTAYGLLMLDRLAWPVMTGQFQTMAVEGWKPGQYFTLSSAKRDLYDYKTFWRTGKKVNPKMYVQSISREYKNIKGDAVLEITDVTFSNLVNELLI